MQCAEQITEQEIKSFYQNAGRMIELISKVNKDFKKTANFQNLIHVTQARQSKLIKNKIFDLVTIYSNKFYDDDEELKAAMLNMLRVPDFELEPSEYKNYFGDYLNGFMGFYKPLTATEQKIYDFIGTQALSNKDIAEQIGCSERTVETHMRSILAKLKYKRREEIILNYKKT